MISFESLQMPLLLAALASVMLNILSPELDRSAAMEPAPITSMSEVIAAVDAETSKPRSARTETRVAETAAVPRPGTLIPRFEPAVPRFAEGLGGQLALMGSVDLEPVSRSARNPGWSDCLRCG